MTPPEQPASTTRRPPLSQRLSLNQRWLRLRDRRVFIVRQVHWRGQMARMLTASRQERDARNVLYPCARTVAAAPVLPPVEAGRGMTVGSSRAPASPDPARARPASTTLLAVSVGAGGWVAGPDDKEAAAQFGLPAA